MTSIFQAFMAFEKEVSPCGEQVLEPLHKNVLAKLKIQSDSIT